MRRKRSAHLGREVNGPAVNVDGRGVHLRQRLIAHGVGARDPRQLLADRIERPVGDLGGTVQAGTIQMVDDVGIVGQPHQARMRPRRRQHLAAVGALEAHACKRLFAIKIRVANSGSGICIEKGA